MVSWIVASRLAVLCLLSTAALPLFGQWSHDPFVNTPVAVSPGYQFRPMMAPDGEGGAIIVWYDDRAVASDFNIYAQRIDASGMPRWTAGGVPICTVPAVQSAPEVVADGAGGAVIVWQDRRLSLWTDLYAQRVNGDGVVQWAVDGVPVTTAASWQEEPRIVSDDAGGAIVTWHDYRSGTNWDIYAQRISSAGAMLWNVDGVAVSVATASQANPTVTQDGSGGAIIAWADYRADASGDIYAQRVAGSGLMRWAANGVAVNTVVNQQGWPDIAPDGAGGAIIAWEDIRSASHWDIYAQRVDSNGALKWGSTGHPVSTGAGSQITAVVAAVEGGAVIAWRDNRYGADWDIFAQRMSLGGVAQWTVHGVPVAVVSGPQAFPAIAADPSGDIVIAWQDDRAGHADIYAQRLSPAGQSRWQGGGVPVSIPGGNQSLPQMLPGADGGVILAWNDSRDEISWNDIYAQRIDRFGHLGINNPALAGIADVPDDQGGRVSVTWERSDVDRYPYRIVRRYSVWRGIEAGSAPAGAKVAADPGERPAGASPVIHRRISAEGEPTSWEWLADVPAGYLSRYRYTAATLADSSASGTPYTSFLVYAHADDPFVFWETAVDSGYSVDNLAPSAVAPVAARVVAGPSVAVEWSPHPGDPDIRHYEVHRSATSGFSPDGSTLIGMTADSAFVDGAPVAGAMNRYRIVAVDVHDNRSAPSPEASAAVGAARSYPVADRWNMVSVPLTVDDYARTAVYPTAVSSAFLFDGMYTAAAVLENGTGYWLKFSGAQEVAMTGLLRDRDTIAVAKGWNMVGSVSSAVDAAAVGSDPPGLVTSNFFGFTPGVGYTAASAIEPGKAYWVKVSAGGKLILVAGARAAESARIRIVPEQGAPPAPPVRDGRLND